MIVLVISLVAVFSLTSCKATGAVIETEATIAVEAETTTEPETVTEEQITLTFWQHEDTALKKATEQIIADFESENPNIKIDYLTAPYTDYVFAQRRFIESLSLSGLKQ